MGLKRWVKHTLLPHTIYTDAAKNMIEEGSVGDGFKKTMKQMYCEDDPLTSTVYKTGKYDGKVEGYAEASDVYEKKLLEQANKFTKEKDAFIKERDEYESLLDKFDKRICELQEKVDKSQQEVVLLNELLLKERELRKLSE